MKSYIIRQLLKLVKQTTEYEMSKYFKKRVKYLENTLVTSTFLVTCLKTYDDEEDVENAFKGLIKFCEIKKYRKGRIYRVTKGFDKNYFKLL